MTLSPSNTPQRALGGLTVAEFDDHVGRFQDAKRHWKRNTWYGNLDEPYRDGTPKVVDQGVAFVSVADIRAAWNDPSVKLGPIGYRNDGSLVYPQELKEAMRLGYWCPKCVNRQERPGSGVCQIKGKTDGCGYTRAGSTGW